MNILAIILAMVFYTTPLPQSIPPSEVRVTVEDNGSSAHLFWYQNSDATSVELHQISDYGIKHNALLTSEQGYHSVDFPYVAGREYTYVISEFYDNDVDQICIGYYVYENLEFRVLIPMVIQ